MVTREKKGNFGRTEAILWTGSKPKSEIDESGTVMRSPDGRSHYRDPMRSPPEQLQMRGEMATEQHYYPG